MSSSSSSSSYCCFVVSLIIDAVVVVVAGFDDDDDDDDGATNLPVDHAYFGGYGPDVMSRRDLQKILTLLQLAKQLQRPLNNLLQQLQHQTMRFDVALKPLSDYHCQLGKKRAINIAVAIVHDELMSCLYCFGQQYLTMMLLQFDLRSS